VKAALSFFPQPYLFWIYSGTLANALDSATWLNTTQELRKLGWRVDLVVQGPKGMNLIQDVDVISIASPQVYLLRHIVFHLRLYRILLSRWKSIDFIYFHQNSLPWLLPLKPLRWLSRRKQPLFVMDSRTLPMEDPRKASWRDRVRGKFFLAMNRWANSWADGQTAITRRISSALDIPPERLWGVWPSGTDIEMFVSSRKIRRMPAGNEPIIVTYIGAMHHERRLLELCQAVKIANQEGLNFKLLLCGDGTARAELEDFARQNDGMVQVLQPLPHAQVPALLAQAHIGALPFPDEEKYRVSSPIKLFEYMASGMPILATRIVCHTDVIRGQPYVFWAEDATPPGLLSALRLAWQNRAYLQELGQAAAEDAQFWTWEQSARKLQAALEPHLQRSRPGFVRQEPRICQENTLRISGIS